MEERKKSRAEEGISEERKKKLLELERQLGRHDEGKKMRNERDRKLMKYFLVAANMMYTLVGPIVLMLVLYFVLKKYVFRAEKPLILVILLFLGAFTGYWSLIKQVTDIK